MTKPNTIRAVPQRTSSFEVRMELGLDVSVSLRPGVNPNAGDEKATFDTLLRSCEDRWLKRQPHAVTINNRHDSMVMNGRYAKIFRVMTIMHVGPFDERYLAPHMRVLTVAFRSFAAVFNQPRLALEPQFLLKPDKTQLNALDVPLRKDAQSAISSVGAEVLAQLEQAGWIVRM
jgi:hypothetical protein